ncbi:hypothetical protein GGI00_003046 [Coemansia sp. RSA 2681]|nr:hypothetical protein GGI00_003046 [Coemansia sp. RSA 2681]
MFDLLSAPSLLRLEAEDESYIRGLAVYVPDYVNLESIQKCLEDKRGNFVSVDSATFSGTLQLEQRPYQQFLVLEKDHFVRFSSYHPPVKFSYKSRNAVMSLLWRAVCFSDMSTTEFVEVDRLWQLAQLPVLYFVFGEDADTLCSNYLIDGNTITEYYESTAAMDMAELAIVAQSKEGLCVSHFFVVNRGKDYWAVDTKDPSIIYAFGPSTKTRTISKLADGSLTLQELIDEEKPLAASDEPRTSQSPDFKLRDVNGEEVAEGEVFALHIRNEENDSPSDIEDGLMYADLERQNMLDDRDWVCVYDHTADGGDLGVLVHGAPGGSGDFGVAVVNGIAYLTFEGKFLQLGGASRSPDVVVLPDVPSEQNRIQIGYNDDGDIVLSQWGTEIPITCGWIKHSYGAIHLHDTNYAISPRLLLRMRLIKAWIPHRKV